MSATEIKSISLTLLGGENIEGSVAAYHYFAEKVSNVPSS